MEIDRVEVVQVDLEGALSKGRSADSLVREMRSVFVESWISAMFPRADVAARAPI
jgi:hypothetical protein